MKLMSVSLEVIVDTMNQILVSSGKLPTRTVKIVTDCLFLKGFVDQNGKVTAVGRLHGYHEDDEVYKTT